MKEKINIIVPISTLDKSFYKEFGCFKYFTNINKRKLIDYTLESIRKLNKKFKIKIIFVLNFKDNKKFKIISHLKKYDFEKKFLVLKNRTKSVIDTCLKAEEFIEDPNNKIIIFHPDSRAFFNHKLFFNMTKNKSIDGILFGYKGFNPIDFNSNNTGRFTIKNNNFVKKIYEKEYNQKDYYTTCGLFYFKKWTIFKKNSKIILNSKLEKYKLPAVVYNSMINKKMKVKFLKVNDFISFSNIESVNEFTFWSSYINNPKYIPEKRMKLNNIIPAAGSGKRHSNYKYPKPLIDISSKPMILRAAKSLPNSTNYYFLLNKNVITNYKERVLKVTKCFKNSKVISINKKTKGMAITCLEAAKYLKNDYPIIISSCDYSFLYNNKKFLSLIKVEKPDAVIFTFRDYPDARIDPNSYAYVKVKNKNVTLVSEKKTISSKPNKDYAVTGIFYFKNWETFSYAVDKMIEKKNLVNGEYYVATAIQELINNKNKVLNFEIDKFISWSLPSHLETYYYWENIYNKYSYEIFKKYKKNRTKI